MKVSMTVAAVFAVIAVSLGAVFVNGQNAVTLTQIVITPTRMEIVGPQAANATITNIKSSNSSVATAHLYRSNQVQIVAVAPGKTTVEFFDSVNRVLYRQPVWVEAANATGGGGAGYDPKKTQLPQIVMMVKRTENITVPGSGAHQLSSVVSSNPGVATARTNTANTIQVYSVALGDTWVDFRDNTTGATYQVHVWVRNSVDGPPAGPAPAPGPISGPGPKPRPSPSPTATEGPGIAVPPGKMDPCLVGDWTATEVVDLGQGWTGGNGFTVKFQKDGTQTVDYSTMEIFTKSNDSMTWTGKSVSKIASDGGNTTLHSIVSGNLLLTLGAPSNNATFPFASSMVGPGGLGGLAAANNYSCTGDTLKYRTTWARDKRPNYQVTLRRQR